MLRLSFYPRSPRRFFLRRQADDIDVLGLKQDPHPCARDRAGQLLWPDLVEHRD